MTVPDARTARRPDADRPNDDQLNDAFHTILREAADRRERRQRRNLRQDTAEARQAWEDLLSLARATGPRE
jgi:hypothetical protein